MSDMLDKMKDLLDGVKEVSPTEEVEENTGPPLEEAVAKALYSLNEIVLYGEYGRSAQCAQEARTAIEVITALKAKYDEQTVIMEALQNPMVLETEII